MVGGGLLAGVIDWAAGMVGAHGIKAGLLASAVVAVYHGHSLMSFLQAAAQTARIGFLGAAAVGLLLVVAISMGWIEVSSLPSFGWIWELVPL